MNGNGQYPRSERGTAPAPPQSRPTRNFLLAAMRADHRFLETGMVTLGERLRCVIVDDNRDFLDAAARLLDHQGISVVAVATSSAEGLRCVGDLQPDVTLVDIDLGGESGFDFVELLNRDGSAASAPAILISTHAEQDFADMIATSPALAFLSKSALSGAAIREALGIAY